MKPTTPTPSYVERSAALNRKAIVPEIETIQATFTKAEADTKQGSAKIVDGVNGFRAVGILLQAICGHDQMHLSFFLNELNGKVSFSFTVAQNCIAIAKRMVKPAETMQEAYHYVQQGLFAAGQLEEPQRTERQLASPISPIQRFLAEMTLIRQPFQKSIRALPMEQWEPAALDTFLTETEWLSNERERARKLREVKK